MACRISELVLKCRDPEALARFWCEVLDFTELDREEEVLIEIGPREGVVVSELIRAAPAPGVMAWVNSLPSTQVATTAVTAAELHDGVARLPASQRRQQLAVAVSALQPQARFPPCREFSTQDTWPFHRRNSMPAAPWKRRSADSRPGWGRR